MERREINVEFVCDRCQKSRAAARFTQKPGEPERAVSPPADWYEVRRGTEGLRHFCTLACLDTWATVPASS